MLAEFQVGVITKTHGLKGDVKVYVTSDDPQRFESLTEVIVSGRAGRSTRKIENVRYFKDQTILKLEGIDDVEEAAKIVRSELLIPREEAMELYEDEYFIGDLIGCRVYLEDGTLFGKLSDVLQTGANDVYDVRTEDGRSVLLPAIKECILSVEPQEERITIHLMDGLI